MAKIGIDLIKPVLDEAKSVEGKDLEVAAPFCINGNGALELGKVQKYESGRPLNFECIDPNKKVVGIIHSHTLPNNKLSYFDIKNRDIGKAEMACVTANDGAGEYQTRCYLLDPDKLDLEELDSYYEIYHNLNKAAEAFLIDNVGKWIIKEMIV